MVGRGEIEGEKKRVTEIAYTGGFKNPRPGSGICGFSTHCIGQSSVMWHDLTAEEAGKCSLVKGQEKKKKVG